MDELDHLGWVVEQSYEVGGVVFGIRANTEAGAEWLHWALAEYETDDNIDPYYSILIGEGDGRGTKHFHILYEESRELVRTLDVKKVGKALLSQVSAFQLVDRTDAVYVEAGLATINGRNILLPGDLAQWLAASSHWRKLERAGIELSFETAWALAPDGGRLLPVQVPLDVPDDAVERLAELAPSSNGDAPISPTQPVVLDAVALNGLGEEVRPFPPGSVAFEVAQKVRNLGALGAEALPTVRRLAESVPGYEFPAWNGQMMLDHMVATFGAA
jgi:hypothetical protein